MQLDKKRILFLTNELGGGGSERVTALLCSYFAQNGLNVHILTIGNNRNAYSIDNRVVLHEMRGFSSNLCLARMQRYIKLKSMINEIRPDIIISLDAAFSYLRVMNLGKKYSLVLSERNYPPRRYLGRNELEKMDRLFQSASKVVFQTPEARDCYSEKVRCKSAVIPNPVSNLHVYQKAPKKRIVTFCRLVPQKRLDLLIDAFLESDLWKQGYCLDIFGDGPNQSKLQAKIENCGLTSTVTIRPFSKDIHEKIADAEFFVSSSDFEGIQNSLLESLCMGIPCIATDCEGGGARMLLQNGKRGLLVPRGDKFALSEAMKTMSCNEGLRKRFSDSGRAASSEFDAELICKSWLDFLRSE